MHSSPHAQDAARAEYSKFTKLALNGWRLITA